MKTSPPASSAAVFSRARRPTPTGIAIAAIVAIGVTLRLLNIRLGLPDFIEEAIPFRRAFEMWGWESGRVDLNPRLFHYPSLTFYLHFLLQQAHYMVGRALGHFWVPADYYLSYQLDPSSQVVLARLLGVLADGVTIVCVARIGERLVRGAGLAAALLVACSPLMILTSRAIFSDTIMTALAAVALDRLLVYEERGGRLRLLAAAVLIGLASGAKYPAALLVPVLAWVIWRRDGVRGLGLAAAGAAAALAAFLATSPYVLLDFATFRRDFGFLGALSGEGHLGSLDRRAFGFYAASLVRDLGWPCALLLAASLVFAVRQFRTRGGWATLWIALLAVGLPISVAHAQALRYLVPVIPLVALLAALAALEIGRRVPEGRRRYIAAILVILLVVPPSIGGARAGRTGADDTEIAARRWLEANLGHDQLLLQEVHGVKLPTPWTAQAVRDGRPFLSARADLRERYLGRKVFRSVTMPLIVSGRATAGVARPGDGTVVLDIFPHAVDINRMFYDPRLLQGVDYVLTSDAVRARFMEDTTRFAAEIAFYRTLDRFGTVTATFRPGGAVTGPQLRIYRLGPEARAALRARDGALTALWWAEHVPEDFRVRAEGILSPGAPASGAPVGPDGRPAPWVETLAPLFRDRLAPFVSQMALQTAELERFEDAGAFSGATLAMDPGDLSACFLFVLSAGALGRWADAEAAAARAVQASSGSARYPREDVEYLRVTWADLLHRNDAHDREQEVLEDVVATATPGSANAERAHAMLLAHAR